ncbi:hypothetical protein BN1013_01992 [Candidatus Rubidus massiliensis]|nr:hypothetical protein BN1013_01992 [Candidatus Rubidus massiliensis]
MEPIPQSPTQIPYNLQFYTNRQSPDSQPLSSIEHTIELEQMNWNRRERQIVVLEPNKKHITFSVTMFITMLAATLLLYRATDKSDVINCVIGVTAVLVTIVISFIYNLLISNKIAPVNKELFYYQ